MDLRWLCAEYSREVGFRPAIHADSASTVACRVRHSLTRLNYGFTDVIEFRYTGILPLSPVCHSASRAIQVEACTPPAELFSLPPSWAE